MLHVCRMLGTHYSLAFGLTAWW